MSINDESTKWSTCKSLVLFSFASISMILLNKASISMFPNMAYLLVLQNFTTILMLRIKNGDSLHFEYAITKQWAPCALLFCVNIGSSLQSLAFISVPTFTVLRNTQPLLASGLEMLLQRKNVAWESVFYLFGVFIGALVYCMHDLDFNLTGYLYATVHVFSMTLYSIVVKQKSNQLKISSEHMSFYNNVLSLPCLILCASSVWIFYPQYSSHHAILSCTQQATCVAIILASCVGGFCISITAFEAQKVISPTAFLCLNNVSKVPATVISLVVFGGYWSFATIHGMLISLLCASFYSISNLHKTSDMMKLIGLLSICSALYWLGEEYDSIMF